MALAVAAKSAGWWVYLLACADGSYYVGITTDVARRLGQHDAGRGARYTRSRRPLTLVATVPCADRAEAMRLEAQLKRLPHLGKERFAREHPVEDEPRPRPLRDAGRGA